MPKKCKCKTSDSQRRFLLLKITLRDITPPIWRRFVVPNDLTLEDLHCCIQVIMGWMNSHLYEFVVGGRDGRRYSGSPMGDMGNLYGGMDDFGDENASDVDLGFADRKGMKFSYTYDFGDSWGHEIVVEDANYDYSGDPPVVVLKGKRNCPPEDCGGPYGYENVLETLKHPENDEDDLLEWIGDYDPEEFDLEDINDTLSVMFGKPKKTVKKAAKKAATKTVKKTTKKTATKKATTKKVSPKKKA